MKYLLVIFLLTSCGSERCTESMVIGDTLNVGTYEKIQCPQGQYVHDVSPKHKPGVPEPTHLIVTCVKVVRECK